MCQFEFEFQTVATILRVSLKTVRQMMVIKDNEMKFLKFYSTFVSPVRNIHSDFLRTRFLLG